MARRWILIAATMGLSLCGSAAAETPAAVPAPSSPMPTLPNGATTITETYADWSVGCGIDKGRKSCVISQTQGNKETGQRSFAVELLTLVDGTSGGTILMPFGLKLEAGALLKLDGKDLGRGLQFSTCLPQGCLLPVALPMVATDALRKGKTLTVAALDINSGKPVTFDVSLNGFGPALDRAIGLGR